MKFVLTWTNRANSDAEANLESVESSQKLLTSGWQPGPEATMREWLVRCDGSGGFAVLETDDPGALYRDIATWNSWLSFELHPVLDITESTPLLAQAIGTAKGAM